MIRKLSSGGYRLYSRKVNPKTGRRRNLGTFKTRPRSTSAPCSISSVIEAANPPPHPALRAWSSAPRAAHARELMAGPNVEGKAQQTRVVAMRGVAMTYTNPQIE
jgi:hypothetical protein